jgi:hypothetical protein
MVFHRILDFTTKPGFYPASIIPLTPKGEKIISFRIQNSNNFYKPFLVPSGTNRTIFRVIYVFQQNTWCLMAGLTLMKGKGGCYLLSNSASLMNKRKIKTF